jgi:hypothetical protein
LFILPGIKTRSVGQEGEGPRRGSFLFFIGGKMGKAKQNQRARGYDITKVTEPQGAGTGKQCLPL